MKKLLIIISIVFISGFFAVCNEDEYYYHTAVNHSKNETVTVSFHRSKDEIVLAPSEYKEIALLKGTDGKFGIIEYSPEKRVLAEYNSWEGICNFYDRRSYKIYILNLTGVAGTLSADDWMERVSFDESNTEQTDDSWLLFTDTPEFKVDMDDEYPASVIYLYFFGEDDSEDEDDGEAENNADEDDDDDETTGDDDEELYIKITITR